MKKFWALMMALMVSAVSSGCDSDDPVVLSEYARYLLALSSHAEEIEEEVDDEDFVLPGQMFANSPVVFDTEGAEASARGPVELGADGWLIGIWAISQEATFSGTVFVGFRPNEDGDEVEAFILLSFELPDDYEEYIVDFSVYIENILADDLDGLITWSSEFDTSHIYLADMTDPVTVIDQCPGAVGPALKLQRAEVDFGIDAEFGDGLMLTIPENLFVGADNLEGPATMGIVTYQRCHGKDFHYEHREFLFGFRNAMELFEEFGDEILCGGAEVGTLGQKDPPLELSCNGDFSDDFMRQLIEVDGSTNETLYTVYIWGTFEEPFTEEIEEDLPWVFPGTGYFEQIEFYCETGDGCNNQDALAAGIAARINAQSKLASATVLSGIASAGKGGSVYIEVTARGAGWPLEFDLDDDETSDLSLSDTYSAGSDLQLLFTGLGQLQIFNFIASIDEILPEAAYELLPEEPEPGDFQTIEGHFVLGCANYPAGYVVGSAVHDLFFYAPAFIPEEAWWLQLGVDWIFDYHNCELRLDEDAELFGDSGNPVFTIDGTFANFFSIDSLPVFGPDEDVGFFFDMAFETEAMGMGWGWNPAVVVGENDFPVFFSAGADPMIIDLDTRSAYQMTSSGAQFTTRITADGGMCVGGEVARNRDGSGNDRCVTTESETAYYAPPLFSYIFLTDCTLNPAGGGFGAFGPLALAIGLIFLAERRRRRNARRS